MDVNYLIVGQGISGTMLSWFLKKEGKSFIVLDDNAAQTPSKVAAGLINPVTGRRYAYTWMIDEIMPFAVHAYQELGVYLDCRLVEGKSIIDFFPSPQMRNAFVERLEENDTYLHSYPNQNHFNPLFQYDFGCGEIKPAHIVSMQPLLEKWRGYLEQNELLLESRFDPNDLKVKKDGILYQKITAEKIIFCDGVAGTGNPWFQLLPYAPNKGEALVISCEGLEKEHVYKKGFLLVPLSEPGKYWVGSNYQWEFEHDQPSLAFYKQATATLDGWLRMPYKVMDHLAAVRPATIERRPFVGLHPYHPSIGILNGMGTKGASLAPFFANQFAQHLVHGLPISSDADVHRFSKILAR